jgi:hypothetical protein
MNINIMVLVTCFWCATVLAPPKTLTISIEKHDSIDDELDTSSLSSRPACTDLSQWEELAEQIDRLSITPSRGMSSTERMRTCVSVDNCVIEPKSPSAQDVCVCSRREYRRLLNKRVDIYSVIRALQRIPDDDDSSEEDEDSASLQRMRGVDEYESALKRSKSTN